MSISIFERNATIAEMAVEMDRRGAAIERLEAQLATAEAKAARLETALVQQRAFVLHWTDDVNGGLKPTLGSLRGALELIDRAANEARQ